MKKRVISVLLAAGMIAGALAGCGGASGGASGGAADSGAAEDLPYSGVTLTVWAANAEINDETMAVLDLATEKLGMEFEIETFLSVVSDDEGIYGVPALTSQGGAVLYYKPDYEELGLEIPKTWGEFIANLPSGRYQIIPESARACAGGYLQSDRVYEG